MKRRTFMYLSVVSAAIGIPSLLSFKPDDTIQIVLKNPVFLSGMLNKRILWEIGIAYRSMISGGNNDQLVKLVLTGVPKRYLKNQNSVELSSFIEKKIKHDISTGNTVAVNGWIISVTEARQCALITI